MNSITILRKFNLQEESLKTVALKLPRGRFACPDFFGCLRFSQSWRFYTGRRDQIGQAKIRLNLPLGAGNHQASAALNSTYWKEPESPNCETSGRGRTFKRRTIRQS